MGPNKIILTKSWTNKGGKKYPIGTVLQVDNDLGSQLIDEGYCEKYGGQYPPKEKTKIQLSKLK